MNENQWDDYPRYNDPLPSLEGSASLTAPPVVGWYKAYCGVNILMYAFVMTVGVALILFKDHLRDSRTTPLDETVMAIQAVMLVVVGAIFLAANIAALFLPNRPWAWIYHLVSICFGLTGCMIVASVPLLIFWIKPETQAYFGKIAAVANHDEPPAPIPTI